MSNTLKPWSILSARAVFNCAPWLRVDSLSVKKADGGKIENFVTRTWRDSCLIVPFLNPNQVIVVRQYKLAVSRMLIEFPAGYMDSNESPYECAQRELREETGYAAQEWTCLGALYREPHYSPTLIHIWLARGLHRVGDPKPDSTEELIYDILPMYDITNRITYGEMCSLYCVAAWGLVREYLV